MAKTEIIISAKDKTKQAFDSVRGSINSLTSYSTKLTSALGIGFGASQFIKISDEITGLNAILKGATSGFAEYGLAMGSVQSIAQSSQVDLNAIGKVYARLSSALQDLNVSQQQVSDVTETLSLGLKAFGATSSESASVLLQLSQAFGSGKLAGDEFRSTMEAAPNLMRELAKSMGVPIGSLKELASQGKITSEVMLKAFTNQDLLSSLREQAERMRTVSGSLTELQNTLQIAVSDFNSATGASNLLAEGLGGVSSGLKGLLDIAAGREIDWNKFIPGGGKSIVVGEDGKVIVDFLSNINKKFIDTLANGKKLNQIKIGKELIDIGDMDAYTKQLEGGKKAVSNFLGNSEYDTKADSLKKQLLTLSTAFKDAVKDIPVDSPDYLAALKKTQLKRDEILEKSKIKTNSTKKTGKSEAEKNAEDAARFVESLQKQVETLDLSKSSLLDYDAAHLKLSASQKQTVNGLIEVIATREQLAKDNEAWAEQEKLNAQFDDEQLRQLEEASATEIELHDARQKSYEDMANQLTIANEDLNIELISSDKKRIKSQLDLEHARALERIEAMGLEAEQAQDLIDQETEHYRLKQAEIEQGLKKTKSISEELGVSFKSAFEDAVVGGEGFGDVLKGLEQDIIRLAARKTILDPLLKAFDNLLESSSSGSGGGGGNFITDFFRGLVKNANGGVYDSPSLSAYSGGVYTSPKMFAFANGGIFAEAGPEAIMPLSRGKDGKLGVQATGGSGANITVNLIESPGNGGQVNQKQDGNNLTLDIMVEKIEGMMGRNINQGRGIAPIMERQYGLNRAAGAY